MISRLSFGLGLGFLVFAALLVAVLKHWTDSFDVAVLLALRQRSDVSVPLGPTWLFYIATNITSLGSGMVWGLLTTFVAGYLIVVRRRLESFFLVVTVTGGWMFGNIVKVLIARPRPDAAFHLVPVQDFSFPSGHATASLVVYLTMVLLLASRQESVPARRYVIVLGLLTSLLIGLSRVYLGVHYPRRAGRLVPGLVLGTPLSGDRQVGCAQVQRLRFVGLF